MSAWDVVLGAALFVSLVALAVALGSSFEVAVDADEQRRLREEVSGRKPINLDIAGGSPNRAGERAPAIHSRFR